MCTKLTLALLFFGMMFFNSCDKEPTNNFNEDAAYKGLAYNETGDPNFPYLITTENKDFILIGSSSNDGIRPIVYQNDNKKYYLEVDNNGVPKIGISGDYTFVFSNYNGELIDMAIITPDEEIEILRNIDISSIDGRFAQNRQMMNDDLHNALSGAGLGISIMGCALSFASLAGGVLPAFVAIPASCGSALLAILNTINNDEIPALQGSSTAVSIFANSLGCGALDPTSCVGLVFDVLTPMAANSQITIEEQEELIDLSYGSLATLDGDIKVTLTWQNESDLDLYVTDPLGETISYQNETSQSGGYLDVDDTDGYGPENIIWSDAYPGNYIVEVDHYDGPSPASFSIRLSVNGIVTVFNGSVSTDEKILITNFSSLRGTNELQVITLVSDKDNNIK